MHLPSPGDFMPEFNVESSVNPNFMFSAMGGKHFLLAFVGDVRSESGRWVAKILLIAADWLIRNGLQVNVVVTARSDEQHPVLDQLRSRFIVFWDHDRAVVRRFGLMKRQAADGSGGVDTWQGVCVARRNLRVHEMVDVEPQDSFGQRLRESIDSLPPGEPARQIAGQAPVLLVPDVLDRATCGQFIDYYERQGGTESGFMRDINGRTQGILDPATKRRRDVYIDDPELKERVRKAVTRRIVPEIRKAFAYDATRIERYMIGCYDESDRGFFNAHRDNVSKATAHRAFAVSLNLNSEDYDGGELRFAEYGPHLYRPETGAAVVFSCSLLHEATPVTRGRRYVILPFLYNDAAAETRGEGRKFLNPGPPVKIGELNTA